MRPKDTDGMDALLHFKTKLLLLGQIMYFYVYLILEYEREVKRFDFAVSGSILVEGVNLFNRRWSFRLLLAPSHRPVVTEMLLKKT